MAINSTSTDAQIEAAYDDNADYDSTPGDLTKVNIFKQASRMLLRRRASTISISGRLITRETIQQELKEAVEWTDKMGGNTPRARGRTSFVGTRFADPARGC